MRRLFLLINILFLLAWLLLFCILTFIPYNELFDQSVQILSLEHKRESFSTLFNQALVLRLRWAFIFLFFTHILSLILIRRNPNLNHKIWEGFHLIIDYPKWLWRQFKSLNRIEKILLPIFLAVIITQRLVLSSQTDVVYDEAWTCLAFTSKNPLIAFVFYPTSNNHILFSHITQAFKLLPFNILTNLRLAAMLPNLLAVVTFFFCLRRYFKPFASWLGVILLAISFPMVYYGFVARGYSLIVLFFVIGFFSVLKILKDNRNERAWNFLVISSVLGFYTIPVYLYPFVSLFGFVFIYFISTKNIKSIQKTIKYGLLTVCLVLLLYSPIFVVSGFQSVFGNKYIQPISFPDVFDGLIPHAYASLRFFIGSSFGALRDLIRSTGLLITFGICVLLYLCGIVGVAKFRNNPGVVLSLVCLLVAPIFVLLHRIIPVERTWIYLLIPVLFLISCLANKFKWYVPILLLTIFYIVISHMNWLSQMLWYDRLCEEDYVQGQHFTTYFSGKNISLATNSRMNTYLKFNGILKKESWNIQSEDSVVKRTNTFIIQYLEDEEPDSIYTGYKIDHTYNGYRLLARENK